MDNWIVKGWDRITNGPRHIRSTDDRLEVLATIDGSGGGATPVDVTVQVGGADISPTNPLPTTDDYNITVTVQPTITAGAYTAGDAIGGQLAITNAVLEAQGSGMITKVIVIDDANQRAPIDIVFFNQTFGATADNAPFDPTDADMENFIGFIDVLTTDYSQFNDNAGASKASGTRMPFDFTLAAGTTLYAQAVVRSTPTYAATGDLTFKFEIRRKAE